MTRAAPPGGEGIAAQRPRAARAAGGSRHHLARNVRTARRQRGWSLHQFGQRTGIKPAYVGALERAEFSIGMDNLDHIAAGLGVAPYLLLLSPDVAEPLLELHLRLRQGEQRLGRQRQVVRRFTERARDTRLADSVLATMLEHQSRLLAIFQTLHDDPDRARRPVSAAAARPPSRRR